MTMTPRQPEGVRFKKPWLFRRSTFNELCVCLNEQLQTDLAEVVAHHYWEQRCTFLFIVSEMRSSYQQRQKTAQLLLFPVQVLAILKLVFSNISRDWNRALKWKMIRNLIYTQHYHFCQTQNLRLLNTLGKSRLLLIKTDTYYTKCICISTWAS